jgi:hypothetical protein
MRPLIGQQPPAHTATPSQSAPPCVSVRHQVEDVVRGDHGEGMAVGGAHVYVVHAVSHHALDDLTDGRVHATRNHLLPDDPAAAATRACSNGASLPASPYQV